MVILGIPTCVLIFIFSESIIHFFMGLEEYGPSVIVLRIFALSIPIIYIDIILGSALMGAADKQKAWAWVGLVAIIINVSSNLLLIPYTQAAFLNGGIGAAIATLITELFVMASALYLLPKTYFKTLHFSHFAKPAMATITMAIPVMLLIVAGVYWIVNILVAVVIYSSALFMFKTFKAEEVQVMKEYLQIGMSKVSLYMKG